MSTREEISEILRSIERYNPGNLDLFANYISDTCQNETYDIEAYLAVLKLYQFNPAKFDVETTRTILLKTMTALPQNDFSLCLYLLPEEFHEDQRIATLIEMYKSLDSCYFEEVWEFLAQDQDVLKCKVRVDTAPDAFEYKDVEVVGFKAKIRQFIAHVITCTYQVVDSKVVTTMLGGLQGAELSAFCEAHGWRVAADGKIFVAHQEEIVKSKNIVESMRFESLVPIMAKNC